MRVTYNQALQPTQTPYGVRSAELVRWALKMKTPLTLAVLVGVAMASGCSAVSPCQQFPQTYEVSRPLTVAEIEAESLEAMKASNRSDVPVVPFGFIHDKWLVFKSAIQPEDKLVRFKSDAASWQGLHGREGYARVSHGCVASTLLARVS